MRLDQLPRSDNIEDRRGQDGGGFRIPGGRGGVGIGTIIVLGLLGWYLGIDPRILIGGADILSGGGGSQQQQESQETRTGAPSDQMAQFVSAVLGGTEAQWQKIFAQSGRTYDAGILRDTQGVVQVRLVQHIPEPADDLAVGLRLIPHHHLDRP